MIRVLQIVPTLGYGGVAQFLLNYYKQMDKSEIRFDFITHGQVESFHEDLIKEGTKIHYFKSIGSIGIKRYLMQLKIVFANNIYDIVHTHDGHLVGVTAFLCKIYFKGPVICHAHTTLCVNPRHRKLMPMFRWFSRHFSNRLLGCGTEAWRYIFGKNSDFTVIHNAVDIDRFQNVEKKDVVDLRTSLNISDSDFVIGHVGLFSLPKNHFYLIQIFEAIYHKKTNAHLVLVGSGDLIDEVRSECEKIKIIDRVHFVGKQSNIPLYMKMFDVFALPSLWEGLPVVGVEAQAAGLHIVMAAAIDHDVDVGMGLVEFIPTSENDIDKWGQALLKPFVAPPKDIIMKAMKAKGYEIGGSVCSLLTEYRKCLQ